jgi:creatinine amidohydrolase
MGRVPATDPAAKSKMTRKHLLQDLTFVELQERMAEDPVVLIPLGSVDEQGPMAPMGDFMLTARIAAMAAQRAGAIAAPIMPFGYADYFRTVPGGIALRPATFAAVLEDICSNFLDHGLLRLVIVNGHSGNYPLIDQVIRKLKRERAVLVPCINLWRSIPPALWREMDGDAPNRGHGADPLTSVYLHLFPELMRMDLAEPARAAGELLGLPTTGLAAVRFQGQEINLAVDVTDHTANGITAGDPKRASAAKGARITAHLVDHLVAFAQHMKAADPQAPTPPDQGHRTRVKALSSPLGSDGQLPGTA